MLSLYVLFPGERVRGHPTLLSYFYENNDLKLVCKMEQGFSFPHQVSSLRPLVKFPLVLVLF